MQGKTINGYTLQRLLGTGGMAEVWYAENRIHKPAAVKLLSLDFAHNASIIDRFQNEAEVMVKLNHPNIRQVYDYGDIDDRPAIVMEYLEGSDLKALIKQGHRFTDEELVKWWNQMVLALNYTHAVGVVHRDIKPSNIFIDSFANVRLLDFGIAKNNEGGTGTLTGSTLGTRIYMSPEQVKDPKRVDYRTDLYSLAVTFVHLLTGKAPYDSSTTSDFEIQLSIVTKPLDLTELPEKWRAFLEPYLEKEPNDRPQLVKFEESIPMPQVEKTVAEPVIEVEEEIAIEPEDEGTLVDEPAPVVMPKQEPAPRAQAPKPKHEEVVSSKKTADSEKPKVVEKPKVIEKPEPLPFDANGVVFNMLKMGGGSFVMGASKGDMFGSDKVRNYDPDARDDERPVHTVLISTYYMAETEVTQGLWKAVMGTNQGWETRYGLGDDYPAYLVSWDEAQDFIKKLKEITGRQFRLPSEAEWEYAARGGKNADGCRYSGDNELDKVGWFADNSGGSTHPVKQKAPNSLGLYDMSGNVWEWCHDKYGGYKRINGIDPHGALRGNDRVLRGGSWRDKANYCRVSARSFFAPINSYNGYGFRLALDFTDYEIVSDTSDNKKMVNPIFR